MSATHPSTAHAGGEASIWRVALAIAWRSMHTYVRRPDLFVPSLVFPLIFLASFAGGLSALGTVPGFRFPAGYTAFQFVFVLCQSAMFAGLFTGFSLAFDFESGFARRLMLAAGDRRGIALGYALVGLARAAITIALVTGVALLAGMRITGNGVDLFGLYGLAALLVLIGYGWAAGVAFRFRSIQAGPLMQTPVFLILFLAPVYVPLGAAQGLDPRDREHQPGDGVPRRRSRPHLRRPRPDGGRLRGRARADRALRRLDADGSATRRTHRRLSACRLAAPARYCCSATRSRTSARSVP